MKKKQPKHFDISNKILLNILFVGCGAVVVTILALVTPWADLQTSTITPAADNGTELVREIQKMNQTLVAIQQKNTTIEDIHQYLLVEDISGEIPYTIQTNTCANGARIIARLKEKYRNLRTNESGEINIQGIVSTQRQGVYSASIKVNDIVSAQMRNLPSRMILDQDTDFIYYTISGGKKADRVEYKIECY